MKVYESTKKVLAAAIAEAEADVAKAEQDAERARDILTAEENALSFKKVRLAHLKSDFEAMKG